MQKCNMRQNTPCLNKYVPTYLLLLSVKYEPIIIKIDRHVLELTLNKIVYKAPTLREICASTTLGNLK